MAHPMSTTENGASDGEPIPRPHPAGESPAMRTLVLDVDALAVESFAALPAGDATPAFLVAAAWSLPVQECFWTRLPTCEIHCVP